MKILFVTNEEKIKRNTSDESLLKRYEYQVIPYGSSDAEIIAAGADARVLVVDAVQPISENVIQNLPNLKLIHSEGVAYNSIDVAAARQYGVDVCNCKGMNAHSVAEQTLLLMLSVIKDVVRGDSDVKTGKQIETKLSYMANGSLKELGECTIGLVGFGDIAKATAKLLAPFGCKLLYFANHRHTEEEEKQYGVEYKSLDELLAESDIVSMHVPVTESTKEMVNRDFLARMKDGAYFINTSRGELVCNEALIEAIKTGKITAAGLDVIAPEPVKADNPILLAGTRVTDYIVASCHIGGITAKAFKRGYAMIWDAIEDVSDGRKPQNIVN